MRKIIAYCLDWHIKSSDAFHDLIVAPLAPYLDVRLTAWDGETLPKEPSLNETLIFCMLPPTEELLSREDLNIFWVPMWDQAQGYDDNWWHALSKDLKVIAFSEAVHKRAESSGLTSLRLEYYKNPAEFKPADWTKGRTLLYWNRVGMVGPEFIEKLCKSLNIDTLIFKPDNDPRVEDNKFYQLPTKIGKTKVEIIHTTKSRDEFIKLTERANIVLSPRLTEGAGMFYLEALARGCVVIAHNAPTMSEYITHRRNGILLSNPIPTKKRTILRHFIEQEPETYAPFLLSHQQSWTKISKLKLNKIGAQAIADHQIGYDKWQNSIDRYVKFLNE